MLAAIIAQEPPDVAWELVDVLVVGVVVGEDNEVLVDVSVEEVVADVLAEELLLTTAVDELDEADDVDVTAEPVWALAWPGWPARAANSPTPASEPAATTPVTARLRRSKPSRREDEVMAFIKATDPQNPLRVGSVLGHKFLGPSWEWRTVDADGARPLDGAARTARPAIRDRLRGVE
jgi:hypothetical protein